MANYGTPDLTGLLPDYHVTELIKRIFRDNQKLVFKFPVFDNAELVVYRLVPGDVPVLMVKDVDWEIGVDDIDEEAISEMLVIDNAFGNTTLLKNITIIKTFVTDYSVSLSFNQLYPNNVTLSSVDPEELVDATTEFVSNLALQVEQLRSVMASSNGNYSLESQTIKILEPDIDGINETNEITDETHNINTIAGISYIRPSYGAFFKDSVVIRRKLAQTLFILDTDYEIIDSDIPLTTMSANSSGVFRSIRFLTAFVGEVEIDYHAYGDTVSRTTMNTMKDIVVSMATFLNTNSMLTSGNLKSSPSFQNLSSVLNSLIGQFSILRNAIPLGIGKTNVLGIDNGNIDFNLDQANYFTHTSDGACTLSVSNLPDTGYWEIIVEATNWGSFVITHPWKMTSGVIAFTAAGTDKIKISGNGNAGNISIAVIENDIKLPA